METKTITALTKDDFRKWLAKNHDRERRVSVVLYKKHTGRPAPSHKELIEEAICFGWIDTTIKRMDEARYIRSFARRTKNSRWSDNTLSYAQELIKQERMMPAGLEFYLEGSKRPTHDAGIPKNPNIPTELKQALAKDKKARDNFEKFPPSTKKMFYRWILRGKREETRAKRIELIVKKAKLGDRDVFGAQGKINK